MKDLINNLKGFLRLASYQPTKAELEFMRSGTWEALLTNHPKNYPLQQFGVSYRASLEILELIKAYEKFRNIERMPITGSLNMEIRSAFKNDSKAVKTKKKIVRLGAK